MNKYAYVTATALALAAGSAQAGGSWGSCGGDDGFDNGVQLNGIPVSGFAVEAVELPDGWSQAVETGGLNGIPVGGFAAEIIERPDGPALAGGKGGVGPG